MRAFAQQHRCSNTQAVSNGVRSGPAPQRPSYIVDSVLHLQRAFGNQAVQRMLAGTLHARAHSVDNEIGSVARQAAGAGKAEQKGNQKPAAPAPAPQCDTGVGLRWGQDTTCSKWGFFQGLHEGGEGKKWKSVSCCNSWPLSLEEFARNQGLNGAASCKVQHEREIATITSGGQEVQVLCSDTIPKDSTQVIEMSPKAMLDLSGQLANPLNVTVCYSGSKEDLCLHNGPGAKSFPTISQCLTRGCPIPEDAPTHDKSGWPRV
jgi:hypothetical protein